MGNGAIKRSQSSVGTKRSSRVFTPVNDTRHSKLITPSVFDPVIDDCFTETDDNNDDDNILDRDFEERSPIETSMDRTAAGNLIQSALMKMFMFESIDKKYLDRLVGCFIPKKYLKGDVIIQQHDEGEYM